MLVARARSRTSVAIVAVLLVLMGTTVAVAEEPVSFARDIQPILSDNCYFCHGPDENHRAAGLRLDRHDEALMVIEAHDSEASELVRRITSEDPDEVMPPAASHRSLAPEEIELLKRWIDQGATWGVHWSFEPLEKPQVPAGAGPGASALHPIDAFVAAKLTERGWSPAPEADRRTLIRRVTLDLTGLPPTPQEVEAFVHDPDPLAYEKVVDRLLSSPAYGERMAWDWLDAARYADTNGYQGDGERTMWPWRDWVVRAFNENLPYDQFTIWQIAGDLLPEPTYEQRLATGFNRNHMINGEGGRIPEENRVEYVMDMAETVGTVWMGLTMNCCRCHDHKFDPLSQRDYFSLFAFFNQTPVDGSGGNPQTPPVLAAPTAEQQQQMATLEQQISERRVRLNSREQELEPLRAEWEQRTLASSSSVWRVLRPETATAEHQQLEVLDDDSILAQGENPTNDRYRVTYSLDAASVAETSRVGAIRLEALRHPSMTQGGIARSDSGNFVLTEFQVFVRPPKATEPTPLKIASADATFEQGGLTIATALDGNPGTGWAVYEGRPVDRDHAAVFRLSEPVEFPGGTELIIALDHDSVHAHHNLGRFRISIADDPAAPLEAERQELLAALGVPAAERTEDQTQRIRDAYWGDDPQHVALQGEIRSLEDQLAAVRRSIPQVMVMEDREEARPTFILDGGLYDAPADPVEAAVPAELPPLAEGAPTNRLGLARWLVSEENPLTARVTVNRYWQQMFGVGLVKTVEDFGVQGEIPMHADLLDWLAADFRDNGWDLKRLMRQIVTSGTYRQSSAARYIDDDPENRWLARGPRFRMPSWMVRDQALAASGLMVGSVGGPGVNGYQPPGVWEEATFGNKVYRQDSGAALYRRSLYTFWRRIIAPTMFFDNASRQTCTVMAFRTNTPLHALLTLNDVTYVEAARAMARRVLTETIPQPDDDGCRIDRVFQRLLARPARSDELGVLVAALERSRRSYREDPEAAEALLAMGESDRDTSLDPAEHAAWTSLCLAVLNLDETLTKE